MRMVKGSHLLPALLVLVSLLLAPAQQQATGDISHINRTSSCATGVPQNVEASDVSTESALMSWNGLSLDDAYSYELFYQEISSTSYSSVLVDNMDSSTPLSNLNNYTTYSVLVRVKCGSSGGYGAFSTPTMFTTLSNKPSAAVSNLTVTPNYNNVPNLVRIHWDHIPHDAWNGNVGGYLVYIYHRQSTDSIPTLKPVKQVNFPLAEQFLTLDSGQYGVVVTAFNGQGNQSEQRSDDKLFIVGDSSPSALLEYPFVYIIVPGIIFVVIIIVINVVIFKKIHETRRRSVTYCKELANNRGGYTNAIPLQELRSPSSSVSPPVVTSPSVVLTQASFANRPLPLSPSSNGPSPTRQTHQHFHDQEPPAFGNGLTTPNFPPAPKLPHPGPLPVLSDGTDPNFAPMQRTLTNQSASSSVFSPTASIPPFQPQQRTRAVTVGDGMPSPYEVPEHNGSTLSRGDSNSVVRPASASAAQHRAVAPRGGVFPPPPAHSPPPLTHSSMELRARMDSGDSVLPGQNTLPRSMGSHHAGPPKPGGMKHIRSEGHFPIFEEKPEVYIRPLDSSVEASLHSGSSYGQNGVARKHSLEAAQYPYRGGLATNGSIVESETFTSFSERTEGSSMIPRAPFHNPAHHDRDRSVRSQGRESLFSETSIELSVSSNSERGGSPAWDHRGATSDVGVGMLHDSPESRETVSEVGTGYKPHHVFKQFPGLSPYNNAHHMNHLPDTPTLH